MDFVFPETTDFSQYKVLIVPALYIADDTLLQRISDYVKNGGHIVMTFKSGFANENSAVRWIRAPGPLREAAGFSYQEFSNLEQPLGLKGDPGYRQLQTRDSISAHRSSCLGAIFSHVADANGNVPNLCDATVENARLLVAPLPFCTSPSFRMDAAQPRLGRA